jgi:hypothetical protein
VLHCVEDLMVVGPLGARLDKIVEWMRQAPIIFFGQTKTS